MFVCNILNSSHLNHLNQGKHFNLMSITILCQNYKKKKQQNDSKGHSGDTGMLPF